jgi:hypothetical protein
MLTVEIRFNREDGMIPCNGLRENKREDLLQEKERKNICRNLLWSVWRRRYQEDYFITLGYQRLTVFTRKMTISIRENPCSFALCFGAPYPSAGQG